MKSIIINEAQLRRLFTEDTDDSAFLDGNDSTKEVGSEAATSPSSAVMQDKKGDDEFSKPVMTDRISRSLTNQSWALNTRNKGF